MYYWAYNRLIKMPDQLQTRLSDFWYTNELEGIKHEIKKNSKKYNRF